MTERPWVSTVVFAVFAWMAGVFAATARAETPPASVGASKDGAGAKASEGDKKKATGKPRKRRKPVHEGDQDENGVVYSK